MNVCPPRPTAYAIHQNVRFYILSTIPGGPTRNLVHNLSKIRKNVFNVYEACIAVLFSSGSVNYKTKKFKLLCNVLYVLKTSIWINKIDDFD